MTREQLRIATQANMNETHTALQTVYDALNKGQKQKLLKNEKIKELFDRYEVQTEEEKT